MKVSHLLLSCCSLVAALAESTKSEEEMFLQRASAQLDRLAPYRKSETAYETAAGETMFKVTPLQMLQLLRDSQEFERQLEASKRIDLSKDQAIERSAIGSGGGSGSFVSGIASGIIAGLTSASGSASRSASSSSLHSSSPVSSASSSHPVYGAAPHVYSYDHKSFDVWDFKKAIFNTLIQAVKAISGGVIALKGQILKGGGFLISTKGRIISTTGEAITSLGRQIAASAVVHPPKETYSHVSYGYEHPPIEHDHSYDGPPPNVEEYPGPADSYDEHPSYPSPSHDDERSGNHEKPQSDDHLRNAQQPNLEAQHPNLQDLENSFGGSLKESHESKDPSDHRGNVNHWNDQQNLVDSSVAVQQLQQNYLFPEHQHHRQLLQQQQQQQQQQLQLQQLQLQQAQKLAEPLLSNTPPHLSIQQSVEYPPIHLQQLQYALPEKGEQDLSSLHGNPPVDLSQFGALMTPLLEPQQGLELPKVEPQVSFHSAPPISMIHIGIKSEKPLSMPLLSPLPAHYWPELLQPIRRKSALQRRRFVAKSSLLSNRPIRIF